MSKEFPKKPISGGANKAIAAVKKFRNTKPSDRLIKIISEYEVEEQKTEKKLPRTAKDTEL